MPKYRPKLAPSMTALLALLLASPSAPAAPQATPAQVRFYVEQSPDGYLYKYVWKDTSGRPQNTEFLIPADVVRTGSTEFRKPDLNRNSQILEKLRPLAEKIAGDMGCSVELQPSQSGFDVNLSGPGLSPELAKQIVSMVSEQRDLIEKEYYKENFYVEEGGDKVRPDYLTIVNRYKSVALAVAQSLEGEHPRTQRQRADRALSFIQSIPYSSAGANGAGFQTPVGMFTQNSGDCDTKSVALASILKAYGIQSVLVTIPDHMFMGVEVRPGKNDRTFMYAGRRFVGAEPSGVGYGLGSLSPESLRHLSEGAASVVEM